MANNTRNLTDKQQKFVENYCSNGYDAGKAYKDAYPNCNGNYGKLGWENKNKPEIRKAIDAYKTNITEKIDYNRDTALKLLTESLTYLEKEIKAGNVQAINARTAILREMSAISNLHSATTNLNNTTKDIPQSSQEIEAGQEAAAVFKLKLANG